MPELIMLVGLPGSGKSTYAAEYKEKGYHVHSSDQIREELFGDIQDQTHNDQVFQTLHKRIKEDLKNGISCVYDATNLTMKRRIGFLRELKNIKCVKKCMLILCPIEECKRRNEYRDRKVPSNVIDKMVCSFDVPMFYEGWDIISVNIDRSVQYVFPMYDLYGFEQENSHHVLSLSDHMYKTACYISDKLINETNMCNKDMLINAALYHDIGKLITKTFINTKGETTAEAHYYGHDHAGSYLYLLKSFYDDYKAFGDRFYIASLINWHMRPYTAWKQSEKSRKRDRKLIGEEMYQNIMLLHEADVAAH